MLFSLEGCIKINTSVCERHIYLHLKCYDEADVRISKKLLSISIFLLAMWYEISMKKWSVWYLHIVLKNTGCLEP